ncbi:MAG: type III pantothenate kinase [Planctomycetota bacterium]
MDHGRRLYADLGNRRLKLRAADAGWAASFTWREATELQALVTWLQEQGITELRLASSSAKGLEQVTAVLPDSVGCRVLAPEQVPLTITTTGTGMDRLLASWFAWQQTGSAVLIADCGTAFTLDLTDADGRFLGGAIGAGLGLQQKALAQACPHLAAADPNAAATVPVDTAGAVAAGTYRAFAKALQGLAAEFESELDCAPQRFLTGGDAQALQELLPDWRVCENMVLGALLALPEDVWA